MADTNAEVVIDSSDRIFPEHYTDTATITTLLSIVDSSVVNFGDTNAVWFFDPPDQPSSPESITRNLQQALLQTLESYPMWCGQLGVSPYRPDLVGNRHRYGRVTLRYHSATDPGVVFVTAHCPSSLSSLIPEPSARPAIWNRDKTPTLAFLPSTLPLAHPLNDSPDTRNPGMLVQVTHFDCGSVAVGIKLHHCHADAHALTYFAKDWAATHHALITGAPRPILTPLFNPELVNAAVAGDIDAAAPDPAIIATARALPLTRHDWWAKSADQDHESLNVPMPFASEPAAGLAMPWSTWDNSAPVSHTILHFSPAQLQHLHAHTLASSPSSTTTSLPSKHDALIAHLWSCITRARHLHLALPPSEPAYCALTFGLRPPERLDLGAAFLGSPIQIATASLPAAHLFSTGPNGKDSGNDTFNNLGLAASAVKATVAAFNNREAVGAQLHSLAFEAAPQRIWQCFLGSRWLLVTSWVWAGVYEVDFWGAEGRRLRFVDGPMPAMDGIVMIVEGTPGERVARDDAGVKQWWGDGVDVSLRLEKGVMDRLVADAGLMP